MVFLVQQEKLDHLRKVDWRLAKVMDKIGGLPVYGHDDPFYFLVREIVGQMISASVKKVLFARLVELCDGEISPARILKLKQQELRNIGLSMSKSSFILNLAQEVSTGKVDFEALTSASDEEIMNTLISIKGIGKWTSKMFLLFYMRRDDILPYEDGAFMQGFKWLYNYKEPSIDTVRRICKKWKPYTSIGARYLYRALDSGLTKTDINCFLGQKELNISSADIG